MVRTLKYTELQLFWAIAVQIRTTHLASQERLAATVGVFLSQPVNPFLVCAAVGVMSEPTSAADENSAWVGAIGLSNLKMKKPNATLIHAFIIK